MFCCGIAGRLRFKAAQRAFLFCNLLLCHHLVSAQGVLTVLNTGGGQPLVTEARPLFVDAALVQPRLQFNFGFATDESFVPNTFLDSFTVTLQSSNQLSTVIYLTTDASGMILAPPTPGTIVVDPASINTDALAYPSLQPVLLHQLAFQVSALIPSQFLGASVNVYFDLADNLDATASQGWFSDLRVTSVPEPSAWMLLLVAGLSVWSFNRLKR